MYVFSRYVFDLRDIVACINVITDRGLLLNDLNPENGHNTIFQRCREKTIRSEFAFRVITLRELYLYLCKYCCLTPTLTLCLRALKGVINEIRWNEIQGRHKGPLQIAEMKHVENKIRLT